MARIRSTLIKCLLMRLSKKLQPNSWETIMMGTLTNTRSWGGTRRCLAERYDIFISILKYEIFDYYEIIVGINKLIQFMLRYRSL